MLRIKTQLPFGREELSALQDQVRAAAVAGGLSAKTAANLVFAIEEIGANILVHSGASWMELRFEAVDPGAVLYFDDDGEEFDLVEAAELMDEPVISEHLSGHLGLWTLKRMPFKMVWKREDGMNRLSISVVKT